RRSFLPAAYSRSPEIGLGEMTPTEEIKRLLSRCSLQQREEIFRYLRPEFSIHSLEQQWHTKAEVILEAIHRASDLTRRGIRGVLAEAAFDVEVAEQLQGWRKTPVSGNPQYDFLLEDSEGTIKVQVKLQRSKEGNPWPANKACRAFRG